MPFNKASLKLLLSFYDCDHICNKHDADKVLESVSGVEMDAYATQLCSPSHSHTPVVLSFSRFLFYVRQEHVHTGNCDIFVSSTHSGRTAMSQCARPGTSSDAAFALKQFLRRNSRTKKDT